LPLSYHVEGDSADYRGVYQERARRPSSDVDVCFGGRIAVTLIRMHAE
jgi:5'-nucleotidase